MTVSFLFAWYDFWVGAYWDRKTRRLYVLPLPMVGIVIDFGGSEQRTAAEIWHGLRTGDPIAYACVLFALLLSAAITWGWV